MNPIRHQAPRRAEWEEKVTCIIEDAGDGMSRSDAQAIIEGQQATVERCWMGYMMPSEAAAAILKASEAQPESTAEARVATVATVNLDDLRRLREEAMAAGPGSGRWIKAAQALMDSFPGYYATAQAMNSRAYALLAMLNELDATLRAIRAEDMDGSEPGVGELLERSLALRLAS